MSIELKARQHGERAIEILADEMENAFEARDRIRAAESVLDRGYGKPSQAVIAVPASQRQRALLAAMTDDSLVAIIDPPKALPAPQLALPNPARAVRAQVSVARQAMRGHGPAADEAAATDPLLL